MKKILYTVLSLLLLGVLGVLSYEIFFNKASYIKTTISTQDNSSSENQDFTYTTIPTLYIHGYQGTANSFGGMLSRFDQAGVSTHEVVLTVDGEGNVSAKGELSGEATNPSVQVIFEDNISHEWNQSVWIENCLLYLQEQYGVKEVNLVGHSMGGVSALRYLILSDKKEQLPQIRHFVAIGSPFNNFVASETQTIEELLSTGPLNKSDRYLDYASGMNGLTSQTTFFIIAGDIEDGTQSDGTVAVGDALSVVYLLKTANESVTYKVAYGKQASHSRLHENHEVDQWILNDLY